MRLSLDAESSDLQARACFIARAKSASHELPQQDWIDRWYPNGVMAPNQACLLCLAWRSFSITFSASILQSHSSVLLPGASVPEVGNLRWETT